MHELRQVVFLLVKETLHAVDVEQELIDLSESKAWKLDFIIRLESSQDQNASCNTHLCSNILYILHICNVSYLNA